MKDPVRPIPSPAAALRGEPHARRYWQPDPDPLPTREPTGQPVSAASGDFDPMALLPGPRRDFRGLDRRSQRRAVGLDGRPMAPAADTHLGSHHLVRANHERVDAILGLVGPGKSRPNWALVRTLTLSPHGLLVHLLDLLDPRTDAADLARGREVMARLIPTMGGTLPGGSGRCASPLSTVGACVLAPRMVAAWSHGANSATDPGNARTHPGPGGSPFAVELVVPCGPPSGAFGRRRTVARIPGELAALTDPNPRVVGIALSPRARTELLISVGLAPGRAPGPRPGFSPTAGTPGAPRTGAPAPT